MSESVEITPGSLAQVHQARESGEYVVIDDDVQGVANALQEIDGGLRLRFSPHADLFVIYREVLHGDGSVEEQLVTTAQELDQRIVARVRKIGSEDYDFAAELERADAEADRAREHKLHEQVGPAGEQLAHALRKDLGMKGGRAFVPGER